MNFIKSIFIFTLLIAICFLGSNSVVAQTTTDVQLASFYYQNEEYDKALLYYKKLFSDYPNEKTYYDFYLMTLIKTEQYDLAIKVAKKQVKRFPNQLNLMVDLGMVYLVNKNDNKANQEFEKAISKLKPNSRSTIDLATAFVNIGKLDYAELTYLTGRKTMRGEYGFEFELAEIYAQKGKFELVFQEYFRVVELNERLISEVKSKLLRVFASDSNNSTKELLRVELLKRVQKKPQSRAFNDILIWYFIQEKKFGSALVHSKAYDKRANED